MGDFCKALWAKKDDSLNQYAWLPLLQHLEDTSRVCGFLWDHWICDGQREIIANSYDDELGRQLVVFLGAIHDLGKATPAFQVKSSHLKRTDLDYELLERLELAGAKGISELNLADPQVSPHNLAGETLLKKYDERFKDPQDIASIVGGHHGRPFNEDKMEEQLLAYSENYFQFDAVDNDVAHLWEDSQRSILQWALNKAGFQSASEIPILTVPGQVQALGLLTMADWIASNTDYFPLIDIYSYEELNTQSRIEYGLNKWFKTHGWTPEAISDSVYSFKHRFGFPPRDVQKTFMDTILTCQQPGLLVLEAPMGLGKTEAALMGAEVLAYKTNRKGVFFGLPTQATSNGIFPRIENWLININGDDQTQKGLRLIHGKANLNDKYVELTNASHIDVDSDRYEAFVTNQWFSGKKTAVLDDFVVGTVDQFLMAALKQKHLALRQLAFGKKVVIIDEVHAYDAYMSQYLEMVLTWMASYGVPVILLSATLSSKSRVNLAKAYLKGRGVKTSKISIDGEGIEEFLTTEAYPLITYTDGDAINKISDFHPIPNKTIDIHRIEASQLSGVIGNVFEDGGNLGIIVNTVRYAQGLARQLADQYGESNVELLHSAFLATERSRKESEFMQCLGKGEQCKRPFRKIYIGTQVIEQSLDIDLDVLISELAPVDILIQRLGRLHRHDRDRPKGCIKPRLYLLGCSDELEFNTGSQQVYGGYLLTRTQYFLGNQIRLPEDISHLVQSVYADTDIELKDSMREKYYGYRSEQNIKLTQKKAKAKNYRLKEPYLGTQKLRKVNLHGWLENPSEDTSEESGNAQVRDADESIEVIALKKAENGYSKLFAEDQTVYLTDQVIDSKAAMKLAGETLRLPRPLCTPYRIENTIHELELSYLEQFKTWETSSWLKGSLGILFDDQMNCELNGYVLHYDKKYGLSYEKKEGEIGKI